MYSCISPLILPFVLLYFLTAYLVWKYQVMYVYSQPYQTGGTVSGKDEGGGKGEEDPLQIWMRVFDQLVGLLVSRGTTLSTCPPCLLPLLQIWMRVFDQLVVGLLVFQIITIALLGA